MNPFDITYGQEVLRRAQAAQRASVVEEAKKWLATPYRHAARVRGAGVDCAMLPLAVYHAAGVIPMITIAHYPPDWNLHRGEERYLEIVERFAVRIEKPGTGDFVLYRWGRCYAHGAIIVEWPRIIHAVPRAGVIYDDGTNGVLQSRDPIFFSVWSAQ